MEIANSVFMEYRKTETGGFEKLAQRNVDFGGGLERIAAAAKGSSDMFQIDTLKMIVDALPGGESQMRSKRIVADHIRSSAFLITDGVSPSNKDRGYMLRKLLRRAIVHSNALLVGSFEQLDSLHPEYKKLLTKLFTMICDAYASQYSLNKELILETLASESAKFEATFRNGIKEMR
jgi:alanyl-tRNA synthetase